MSLPIDPEEMAPIRELLWAPITVVTTAWQGRLNAQIALGVQNSSVLPTRPRVITQIAKRNFSHGLIYKSGVYALCFIGQRQLDLTRRFGFFSGRDRDKLAGVSYWLGVTGCPILEDCWAYMECRVVNAMDSGSGTCFLADVVAAKTLGEADPMWWRDVKPHMPPEWQREWEELRAREIEFAQEHIDRIQYTAWPP